MHQKRKIINCITIVVKCSQAAVVAERLRRLTRNQIPSGSVGSNPTDREIFFRFILVFVDANIEVEHG